MADPAERGTSGAGHESEPDATEPGGPGGDETVALTPSARSAPKPPERTPTSGSAAEVGGDDATVALPADPSSTSEKTARASAPSPAAKPVEGPSPAAEKVPRDAVPASSIPPAASGSGPGAEDYTVVTPAAGSDDETVITPPPHGRPRLVLRDADGSEREFPLAQPEVTIGRSSSCDIALSAATVSRLHARITQRADEWVLIPVGSHRNTYVNDELVTLPHLLHDGDRVQLADERLVYRCSEGPLASPRPRRQVAVGALVGVGVLVLVAVALYARRAPVSTGTTPQQQPGASAMANAAASAAAAEAARAQQAEIEGQHQAELARQREAEAERQSAAEAERRRVEAQADAREQQIGKLLYQGDVAMLDHQYTTPVDGSAVYAYREVLKLDPTNARALSQSAAIIDDYLTWAEQALRDGRHGEVRVYADKAAYVHEQIPGAGDAARINPRLDALRRSVK